jgi:N12 class adenine-specific DNA methylase
MALSFDEIDQIEIPQAQNSRSLAGKLLSPDEIDSLPAGGRPQLSPQEIDSIQNPIRFRSVDTTVPGMRTTRGGPPLQLPEEAASPFDELEGPVSTTAVGAARTAGSTLGAAGKGVAAIGEDVLEAPTQIAGYQQGFRNIRSLGRVKSVGNLLGGIEQEQPTPFEEETQQTTGIPRFARTATTSLLEMEPRLAAGFALGAAGVPASLAAAAPMVATDKGELDPIGAAIAAGLPGVSSLGEDVVAKLLSKVPVSKVAIDVLSNDPMKLKGKITQELGGIQISSDQFRHFLESGGGFLAANAYLAAAEVARNPERIGKMTAAEAKQYALDFVAQNLAPALLGFIRSGESRTIGELRPGLQKEMRPPIEEAAQFIQQANERIQANGDLDTQLKTHLTQRQAAGAGQHEIDAIQAAIDNNEKATRDLRTRARYANDQYTQDEWDAWKGQQPGTAQPAQQPPAGGAPTGQQLTPGDIDAINPSGNVEGVPGQQTGVAPVGQTGTPTGGGDSVPSDEGQRGTSAPAVPAQQTGAPAPSAPPVQPGGAGPSGERVPPVVPTGAPAQPQTRKPEVANLGTGTQLNNLGDPLGTAYYATPEDYAKWTDLQKKLKASVDRMLELYKSNERGEQWDKVQEQYRALQQENEDLKNKYGGMPPAAPKVEVKSQGATNPNPTPAQTEAGNYQKRELKIEGLPAISIENEAGGIRKSKPGAPPWQVQMPVAYGYFKGTKDNTKEHVDVYVGPNLQSDKIFVVDQLDPDTHLYDEPKVLLGFNAPGEARMAYAASFSDGKGNARWGTVTQMTREALAQWLKKPTRIAEEGGQGSEEWLASQKKTAARVGVPLSQWLAMSKQTNLEQLGQWGVTQAQLLERAATKPAESGTKGPESGTKVPETKPERKTGDLEGLTEEELDSMLDTASTEAKKPEKPKAPKAPKAPVPVKQREWREIGKNAAGDKVYEDRNGVRSIVRAGVRVSEAVELIPTREGIKFARPTEESPEFAVTEWKPTIEPWPAEAPKKPRSLGTKGPAPAPKQAEAGTKGQEKTPAEIIAEAAKQGVTGIDEAVKGLHKLFGGGKHTGTGGPGFDEETYKEAKPHFEAAYDNFKKAGRSFADFLRYIFKEFGDRVRPYIKRFIQELQASAKAPIDTGARGPQPPIGANERTEGTGGPGVPGGEQPPTAGATGGEGGTGVTPAGQGQPVQPGVRPPDEGATSGSGSHGGGAPIPDADGVPKEPEPKTPESSTAGVGPEATGQVPSQPPAPVEPAGPIEVDDRRPTNFYFEKEHAPTGAVSRIEANVKALKLVKELQANNRFPTDDERAILAAWSGWGSFKELFAEGRAEAREWDAGWVKRYGRFYDQLKKILSPKEFIAAAESSAFAHYTGQDIIKPMWDLVKRLGYKGGRALDPSAGKGSFSGFMPSDVQAATNWTQIELEPITGAILGYLFPRTDVRVQGFENAKIPNGYYELAITNVPFHEVGPGKEYPDLNLHNYFIARMLDKVRPGGLVVVITSANTMEAQYQQRKFLAGKGELVGAIRLPNNAHKEVGGTEVTTDILVLRKPDGKPFEAHPWENQVRVTMGDEEAPLNQYFATHPEMVLGRNAMEGKLYRKGGYTVQPTPGALLEKIAAAIQKFPQDIFQRGEPEAEIEKQQTALEDNSLVLDDKGRVMKAKGYELAMPDWDSTSKPLVDRAKDYIGLRDVLLRQYFMEGDPEATDEALEANRAALKKAYEKFVKKHGRLNEIARKLRHLEDEPYYYTVMGLENVREVQDPEDPAKTKTLIEPADVLTKRVKTPDRPPAHVDTATDGLGVSLAFKGQLDMEFIKALTGLDETAIEADLITNGGCFKDPDTGKVVTGTDYLSGDVRDKLAKAMFAAKESDEFKRNVEALRATIPETIPFEKISTTLNARWTPLSVLNTFAEQVIGLAKGSIRFVPVIEEFSCKQNERFALSNLAKTQWSTADMLATELLNHALNFKRATITKTDSDGKRYTDEDATALANQMIDKMRDAYLQFIRESKEAVPYRYFDVEAGEYKTEPLQIWDVLEREFNKKVNSFVDPKYDGSVLKLPGLSTFVKRNPHLLNGVMRAIMTGSAVFAHGVGSGKTFLQILIAHELQRIGLARKMVLVVKKPTVGQFRVSIEKAYPGSKVLIPTQRDFEASNRKKLIARIASTKWDFIVLSHEQFKAIKPGSNLIQNFFDEQINALLQILHDQGYSEPGEKESTRGLPPEVRNIVRKIRGLRKRLTAHLDTIGKRQDTGLPWEDIGIDGLSIDESHNFKKIPIPTQMDNEIKGIPNDFSQRAVDMLVKVRNVQQRTNGRNVFFASGTPVSNTLAELWVQFHATNPNLLKAFNVETFDSFASTFADVIENFEYGWDQQFHDVTRMSRFKNPAGLTMLTRLGMDVRMGNKELGLDVPEMKTGKPIIHIVKPTKSYRRWIAFLNDAVAAWESAEPKERFFNSWVPITVMRAGVAAALDPRCVFSDAEDDPASKVNQAVRAILEAYKQGAEHRSTMMVFADMYGTLDTSKLREFVGGEHAPVIEVESVPVPGDKEADEAADSGAKDSADYSKHLVGPFNLYDDIRRKLIAGGVPEHEIGIAIEHDSDAARETLFNKVRQGIVRILIGSTEKIGEGVDVPQRMMHQFHLDPPMQMTPAKYEQRLGRIIRQGNMFSPKNLNIPVEVHVLAQELSMDAAIWQMLETKAVMILQALRGQFLGDTFEDPASDITMAMAEIKAAATGDRRALQLVQLKKEVRDLSVEEGAYFRRGSELRRSIDEQSRTHRAKLEYAAKNRELGAAAKAATANDETASLLYIKEQKRVTGKEAMTAWLKAANEAMEKVLEKDGQRAQMSLIFGDNLRCRLDVQLIFQTNIEPGKAAETIHTYRREARFYLGGPEWEWGNPTWDSSLKSIENTYDALKRVPEHAEKRAQDDIEDAAKAEGLARAYTEQLNNLKFDKADILKEKKEALYALERELMDRRSPWDKLLDQAGIVSPPLHYRIISEMQRLLPQMNIADGDASIARLRRNQLKAQPNANPKAVDIATKAADEADKKAFDLHDRVEDLQRRLAIVEKHRLGAAKAGSLAKLPYGTTPTKRGTQYAPSPEGWGAIEAPTDQLARATGIEELRQLLKSPQAALSDQARRIALALLDEPVMRDLDWSKLTVAIRQNLRMGAGSANVADNLIQLSETVAPDVFPHEVFHFLWHLLPEEVKQQINGFRQEAINAVLARITSLEDMPPALRELLQDMVTNPGGVSSEDYLTRASDIIGGNPELHRLLHDWYYLSSPQEYLAGLAGRRYARDKSGTEEPKKAGLFDRILEKLKEWLRGLLETLRRFFGHKPDINGVIDDLLSGKYRNSMESGTAAERQYSMTPPETPGDETGINLGDIELTEGAAARAEGPQTTQRMGVIDKILGREAMGPGFTERGKAHAMAQFTKAGLQTADAPDGYLQLAAPELDSEIEGRRLLKLLQEDIAKQQTPGRGQETGELAFLLNSIRLHMIGDEVEAFSPTLRAELYATAQGESSHRGLMLGALAALPKTIQYLARNVNTVLNRTYSDAFGGELVRKILQRVATDFRDYFTEAEIQAALAGTRMEEYLNKALALNRRDEGGRVYRKAQQLLKAKGRKTLARLEGDARVTEAVREILAQAAKEGFEPQPSPNKPLPPLESLLLMVHPQTAEKIDRLIAKAITDAMHNAGIKQALNEAPDDETREELQANFDAGEEPTDEQMEKGLDLPEFQHWKAIRDNLTDYNPVTVKLAQDLIRGDFRGTRFRQPIARPADSRIDLEKLAQSPKDEVRRVMDGYLMNLEANMDLTHATDETKQRVVSIIETELLKQLESARERVRGPLFQPPPNRATALTPEQRLGLKINAGLFGDPRLDLPEMIQRVASKGVIQKIMPKAGELVRQSMDVPFYRQQELAQRFAQQLIQRFSIPVDVADRAAALFEQAFTDRFEKARAQAIKQTLEGLTPQERRQMKPGKPLWQKVVAAVNAGNFDSADALRAIAQAHGWSPPSAADVARLKAIAEQLQKLRELTPQELAEAGNDPEALRRAQVDRDAITLERRAQLSKAISAAWAKMVRPISWPGWSRQSWFNAWGNRQNIAAAINEFMVANMLDKIGFLYRLPTHILTQLVVHIPTRAIGYAWVRHTGGDPTPLWRDTSRALADGYGRALAALRPAIASARSALAGRGEARNVDRLVTGILMFERLEREAQEAFDRGEFARSAAMRLLGYIRFSLRFVQAVDNFQGVPAEYGEMAHQIETGLRGLGMSPAEIQVNKERILGRLKEKLAVAIAKARETLTLTGQPFTEREVIEAAWDLIRSNIYEDIRNIGLPSDDFKARNERLRRTIAWQERVTTGPGGIVAAFGRGMSSLFASAGLPFSFARFANAVGTGINYSLMNTPLAWLANAHLPGAEPSPWFATEEDRAQRKAQALIMSALGGIVIGAIFAGALRVFLRGPKDKEERDLWEAQGHRAGTIEFVINDHEFIPISLTVGPGSIIAPYAAAAGALVDLLQARAKSQAKLEKEALKAGVAAGKIPALSMTDMLSVAAQAAWGTLVSSKALTGVVQSTTEYGIPNVTKTAAAYVSPAIAGLPGYQEVSRMMGVNLDSKLASFWDFLVPLPGSQARAVNMLGDPVKTPDDVQRIIQTITSGTYPGIVDTDKIKDVNAYAALFNSGYRPPAIEPGKGYAIDGEFRPMTSREMENYAVERGTQLKASLEAMGPNADAGMIKAAFKQANEMALEKSGVNVAATAAATAPAPSLTTPGQARYVSPGQAPTGPALPGAGSSRERGAVRLPSARRGLRLPARSIRGPRGPSLRPRGAIRAPLRRSGVSAGGIRSLRPRVNR